MDPKKESASQKEKSVNALQLQPSLITIRSIIKITDVPQAIPVAENMTLNATRTTALLFFTPTSNSNCSTNPTLIRQPAENPMIE